MKVLKNNSKEICHQITDKDARHICFALLAVLVSYFRFK